MSGTADGDVPRLPEQELQELQELRRHLADEPDSGPDPVRTTYPARDGPVERPAPIPPQLMPSR